MEPKDSPLPPDVLDAAVENVRWLQEQGLLRPITMRPPLLRIHPHDEQSTPQPPESGSLSEESVPADPQPQASSMRVPRASLGWSWFLLALATLLIAAHMFRYEKLSIPDTVAVWDRWAHRVCTLSRAGAVCLPSVGTPPAR